MILKSDQMWHKNKQCKAKKLKNLILQKSF